MGQVTMPWTKRVSTVLTVPLALHSYGKIMMTVHLSSGLRLSDSKLAITEKRLGMAVKYKA